nr:ATP-binding protein [Marinobacter sp. BGYM27]
MKTTLCTFLDDLVHEWRAIRPIEVFLYDNRIEADVPVVFDTALKQMIWNVLDNALEASPHWVRLDVSRESDTLRLVITDTGPGFPSAMLAEFGKPYQSSKGRPGGGLGLFLSVNVARTLGGTVTARNRPEGGAVVQLTLPLVAISLEQDPRHGI